jgi:hypothetical protein
MERVKKRAKIRIVLRPPSILNLRRWIPQKDVIKLILMYLNKVDWKLVWAAHNKKYEKYLELHFHFWDLCAFYGYLDLIKWGVQTGKAKISAAFFDYAAQSGHLKILEWGLCQNLTYWPDYRTIFIAIGHGHTEFVKWFCEQKPNCIPALYDLILEAQTYGRIKLLNKNVPKYIKEFLELKL